MRAFITGISGFVGGHLGELLRTSGDAVLGVDRGRANEADASPLTWDLAAGPPETDIRRRVETFAPDVLFHLAAVSVPRECGADEPTPQAVRTNVDGTRHVLEFAQSLPQPPRVVFMSTSHVYAPISAEQPFVAESYPLGPRNGYGRTKLAAEELCRTAKNAGLDVVIVRSFTQSGPGQDVRLMLAEWAEQFVRGGDGPIEVASLDVTIDFLDVRDAVRALRAIALHGVSGAVYNLGSGVPRTTGEIFDLLRAQSGDPRPVRELRPGRRSDPIADATRLRTATGWSPQISPAQTVADVLADRRRRAAS